MKFFKDWLNRLMEVPKKLTTNVEAFNKLLNDEGVMEPSKTLFVGAGNHNYKTNFLLDAAVLVADRGYSRVAYWLRRLLKKDLPLIVIVNSENRDNVLHSMLINTVNRIAGTNYDRFYDVDGNVVKWFKSKGYQLSIINFNCTEVTLDNYRSALLNKYRDKEVALIVMDDLQLHYKMCNDNWLNLLSNIVTLGVNFNCPAVAAMNFSGGAFKADREAIIDEVRRMCSVSDKSAYLVRHLNYLAIRIERQEQGRLLKFKRVTNKEVPVFHKKWDAIFAIRGNENPYREPVV